MWILLREEAERGELSSHRTYLRIEARRRTIGADVVAHRRVCMGGCDVTKGVVPREVGGNKEHLEVHHVVNDNLWE